MDVGSIPEVSYEFFLDSVLPTPAATSTIDLAKIKDTLVNNGAITDGRWSAFPTDPAKQSVYEDVVFSGLLDVNKRIIDATNLVQPTTCIFTQKPHESPTSNRVNKTRPDGYRTCGNLDEKRGEQASSPTAHCSKEHVCWHDVVEVEEYKKRKSLDDVRDVSCYVPPFPLCSSSPRIT